MEKSPAFQFYPKDWLSDMNVALMTPTERGGYIQLMAKEWLHDGLPLDDNDLAELSGLREDWYNGSGEKIKKCFKRKGKKLVHPRLEKERKKQRDWREKCSVGGKKSASMRNEKGKQVKGSSTNLERVEQVNGNTPSSSSFPSSTSINTIKDIVVYLNQAIGKNYKPSSTKTSQLINTRLSEGFTVDDFKKVIDIKNKEWGKNKEFCKFLRPETLFGTKFEGYLNQPEAKKEKSKTSKYDKLGG